MDIIQLKELFYKDVFTEAEPVIGEDGRYHGVYVIQNQVNYKLYIGKHSTTKLDDGYFGSGVAIGRAIKKYGREEFKMKYIHFSESAEQVHLDEDEVIGIVLEEVFEGNWSEFKKLSYNLKRNQGYNSISDETRKKLSEFNLGKTFSEETKRKMSEAQLGVNLGCNSATFKGFSIGHNEFKLIIFCGEQDMKQRGFESANVSHLILKKTKYKSHKGYTSWFRTLNKSDLTELLETRTFADTESLEHYNNWIGEQ